MACPLVNGGHDEPLPRANGPASQEERADDFLSGSAGHITGVRATTRSLLADGIDATASALRIQGPRLTRAARSLPQRHVLALAVERTDSPNLLSETRAELHRSRHKLDFLSADVSTRGKFENLNQLLVDRPPWQYEWLLVLDDDVTLPRGFLDRFLFLCERFELKLAQPAHRHRSNAAWRVTRRQRGALVRETFFVEIGPVTAFHRDTFETLLPFPHLRAGWGLDLHWSAVGQAHRWRMGIVDATAIRHRLRPVAAAYDTAAAVAEARDYLRQRPYVTADEAQRTLRVHRGLRRPTPGR